MAFNVACLSSGCSACGRALSGYRAWCDCGSLRRELVPYRHVIRRENGYCYLSGSPTDLALPGGPCLLPPYVLDMLREGCLDADLEITEAGRLEFPGLGASVGDGPGTPKFLSAPEAKRMTAYRVYSDFHGGLPSRRDPRLTALGLGYYGSLADLLSQRVRLQEGMKLVIHCDNDENTDFEVDGVVFYDRQGEGSAIHRWKVEVDMNSIREVPARRGNVEQLPCINCGVNMYRSVHTRGLNESSACPQCGTAVYSSFNVPSA